MKYVQDNCEQLDVSDEQADQLIKAGLAYYPDPDDNYRLTVPWDGSLDQCEMFIREGK